MNKLQFLETKTLGASLLIIGLGVLLLMPWDLGLVSVFIPLSVISFGLGVGVADLAFIAEDPDI